MNLFLASSPSRAKSPSPRRGASPGAVWPATFSLENRALLAAAPVMLDLLAGETGSSPREFTAVNNTVFFETSLTNGQTGFWKSDGSPGGTTMLRAFEDLSFSYSVQRYVNVNGTLFFVANDGATGAELWKSDGTTAGTVLVKDITPGLGSSFDGFLTPPELQNINGTLFFDVTDHAGGISLWASDGTSAGTRQLKAFQDTYLLDLTNVNGTLFFVANDGVTGFDLWKSDGSTAGTTLVEDLVSSGNDRSAAPNFLANVNGLLFFDAGDPSTGRSLWRSNGTDFGTVPIKDFEPPGYFQGEERIGSLVNVNGTLFFSSGRTGSFGGGINARLWKSDGTAAGTVVVKSLEGSDNRPLMSLVNVSGTLFFGHASGPGSGYQLWKSDGTDGGTVAFGSANSGFSGYPLLNLTNVNGTLFFSGVEGLDSQLGIELLKSDGTAGGTVLVADLQPGQPGGGFDSSHPLWLTNVNGWLFFTANDGAHGRELWVMDGGGETPVQGRGVAGPGVGPAGVAGPGVPGVGVNQNQVSGLGVPASSPPATQEQIELVAGFKASDPDQFTDTGNGFFFAAWRPEFGRELFFSDGTSAGTRLVRDIVPGTVGGVPLNLTNVNGRLFFTASDATGGRELWVSNGTTAGTKPVRDIRPGVNASNPEDLTNVSGRVFFTADDGIRGRELWFSDGTGIGTFGTDLHLGPLGSDPDELVNSKGTLFFSADDGVHGRELWRSINGTFVVDTYMVLDLRPGLASSRPSQLTNVGGVVYFAANNGTNGFELWKSTGTAPNTLLVKDIQPGSTGSGVNQLVNYKGILAFSANDGVHGYELWRSNGASGGTFLVRDLESGAGNASPLNVVNQNGTLMFTAFQSGVGRELWRSNSAFSGTALVSDIRPGPGGSWPQELVHLNGRLFFVANDGAHGIEPWSSTGTSASTNLVADLRTGRADSLPMHLATAGATTLVMSAMAGENGRETWVLRNPIPAPAMRMAGPASRPGIPSGVEEIEFDGWAAAQIWQSRRLRTNTRFLSGSPDRRPEIPSGQLELGHVLDGQIELAGFGPVETDRNGPGAPAENGLSERDNLFSVLGLEARLTRLD